MTEEDASTPVKTDIKVEVKSEGKGKVTDHRGTPYYVNFHTRTISEIGNFFKKYREEPQPGQKRVKNEDSLAQYLNKRRQDKRQNNLDEFVESLFTEHCPWFRWGKRPAEKSDNNSHRGTPYYINFHRRTVNDLNTFYKSFKDEPRNGLKRSKNEDQLALYISKRRSEKSKEEIDPFLEDLMREHLDWFDWGPEAESVTVNVTDTEGEEVEDSKEEESVGQPSELAAPAKRESSRNKSASALLLPENSKRKPSEDEDIEIFDNASERKTRRR